MFAALKEHWPEYLMEAAGLGIILISACVVDALLEHPASPVRRAIPDPTIHTILKGLTRGLIAVGLIYWSWKLRKKGPVGYKWHSDVAVSVKLGGGLR